MSSPARQTYYVKAVPAGDQLLLVKSNSVPPSEHVVALSHVGAPRLASKQKNTQDEPWAWEARERIRKLVVGKTIEWESEGTAASSEGNTDKRREFGAAYFQGKSLAQLLLSEGLADLHSRAEETPQALRAALDEAKAAGKGKWSSEAPAFHVRQVAWESEKPEDINVLADALSGTYVRAIVEHVVSASMIRVLLLPSFETVTVGLSGLSSLKSSDPLSSESRFFVERQLLNREVTILFEGSDRSPSKNSRQIIGSIVNGKECFQAQLLSRGLATLNNFTAGKTEFRKQLADAENTGKENKAGVWKKYEEGSSPAGRSGSPSGAGSGASKSGKVLRGVVQQVHSGDALRVLVDDGSIAKVGLAYTRAHRVDYDSSSTNRRYAVYPQYAWQAREFLRTRLIGERVELRVEYVNKGQGETKQFVSVIHNGENVGLTLIREGFAELQLSTRDKSAGGVVDELIAAEEQAKSEKRGLWGLESTGASKKKDDSHSAPGTVAFHDLFRVGEKTTNDWLNQIGTKTVTGIVEALVSSPSRFTISVPEHNVIITLTLVGILTPSIGQKDENKRMTQQPEPFGMEALEFSRAHFVQRDCEVQMEKVDRTGTLFGTVFVNGRNASVTLLENGLAAVNPFDDSTTYADDLQAAETLARGKNIGVHTVQDEHSLLRRIQQRLESQGGKRTRGEGRRAQSPGSASPNNSTANKDRAGSPPASGKRGWEKPEVATKKEEIIVKKEEPLKVNITEVVDPTHVYVQASDNAENLKKLNTLIKSVNVEKLPKSAQTDKLVKDQIVLARFTTDKQLYRAKVLSVNKNGDAARVAYIDYGNTENVPRNQLWIVETIANSRAELPPLASVIGLAFIEAPSTKDMVAYNGAGNKVQAATATGALVQSIYTEGRSTFGLFTTGNELLQEVLLRDGLVKLKSQFKEGGNAEAIAAFSDVLPKLVAAEADAQSAKRGVWAKQ